MKGQYVISANCDIRRALKECGIPLWQLGVELNVSEGTIVRWLRQELPESEKARIYSIIKRFSRESAL